MFRVPMRVDKLMLVFRYDTSNPKKPVLVPLEVPEGINSNNVGEWLHTLETHNGYTYAIMLSDYLCNYYPTKEERILYAKSIVRGLGVGVMR